MMAARHRTGEDIHLVKSQKTGAPNPFRVSSIVRTSGIYRATHGDHRLAHEVTLLAGQKFPPCKVCGRAVRFELVREAAPSFHFRVVVHQLPHPEADSISSPTPEQVA